LDPGVVFRGQSVLGFLELNPPHAVVKDAKHGLLLVS
jgi:hypothetical protein